MIAWFRFALIAVLLAGIACLSAIVTMQFAVHRTIVTVPDLQGETVAEATSQAARLGLDLTVTQRFYSTVLPAHHVLLQTPAPNARVRRGWDLAVAESLGPRHIAIPNVGGRDEREAILALRQKGLELGAVAQMPDSGSVAGTVVAQDPGAGAAGAAQPSVSLLVATPQPTQPPAWVMPDAVGHSYSDAEALLTRAGMHVSAAAGAPPGAQIALSPSTPAGTVLAQSPPAGARVDGSSNVTLWVAGAPAAAAH